MNIPPQDFRWYAAFHDEGDHPHVHMMAWSVKPGQAYLSQDGIRQIKSKLTNDIFQQEMLHLYALGKLYLSDDASVHDSELGIQWLEHAAYNGNHYASYRLGKEYLKGESVRRDTRKAMDHIYTSAQAGNPHAQYLLGKLLLQGKVIEQDKDAGIQWLTQAAEQGHSYAQCLLERQRASIASEVFLAVTRLLHHMANVFQDKSLPQSGTGLIHADRKLREQLREKRLAHGHKENDHEEQQYGGWNMTMR